MSATHSHPPVLTGAAPSEAMVEVRTLDSLDGISVVTQPPQKEDTEPSALESTRTSTISSNPTQMSDGGSIHSIPAVQITVPASPGRATGSHLSIETSSLSNPTPRILSPSRSHTMQEETLSSQQPQRSRRRSAIEARSSNRLSGFFSTLMNRRELHHTSSREPIREDVSTPDPPQAVNSEEQSRASSPLPTRPSTPPPPPLPPPTLRELGLDLSALTAELSPSHFTSPPNSGAFIAPHYLLLCHAQGLDVIPLVSPPAIQPYALIRRVNFKSVVVMEQRGVMVAIAGRRDGVRIYALEEVKKAIEWRMEFEMRRERERTRKDVKKSTLRSNVDLLETRQSNEKLRKGSLSTPPPDSDRFRSSILRKSSHNLLPLPASPPPVPLIPRSATARPPKKRTRGASIQGAEDPAVPPGPSGFPPPYAGPSEPSHPVLHSRPSFISLRPRGGSVSEVLAAAHNLHHRSDSARPEDDSKADWAEHSDDEAIDVVAAGASGTHLDERTSSSLPHSNNLAISSPRLPPHISTPPHSNTLTHGPTRRARPGNLDLTLARSGTIPPPEPSPAPTLLTIRQALSHSPTILTNDIPNADTPTFDDEEEEDVEGNISLAQALMESRIPDLPPPGTMRPQEPILLSSSSSSISRPTSSDAISPLLNDGRSSIGTSTTNGARRRRRWSIMISSPTTETSVIPNPPQTAPGGGPTSRFSRSHSIRSNISQGLSLRSATDPVSAEQATPVVPAHASVPDLSLPPTTPTSSRSSRFIPRIISDVLHRRKSTDRFSALPTSPVEYEGIRWSAPSQPPPPKLEYVKLPGTKGSLLIKSVETAKKSFLAILCGENGEKVELFAGTYRTALGLSRTFILPDSPRSLELQLQGDDLVEVFLVFAQNVFGLEPATVRVREVRIGRAERRAARRRARENSSQVPADGEQQDEDTNVNVSIGVSVAPESSTPNADPGFELIPSEHPGASSDRPVTPEPGPSMPNTHAEELMLVTTAQMGPYTTFQQLNFAPHFPLAAIADECIIPPTYPSFLNYKSEFEGDSAVAPASADGQAQFSPPGLPIPTLSPPSKWFYRDPKHTVHGPWKASLMQAWYKDGLLPPDLPVRREEDGEYTLLKDLRLQSIDPSQPFRAVCTAPVDSLALELPLLPPISLLEQPKHFGPPALFFSSRGGHSTSIVDARGRSVLKGRFIWSSEDSDISKPILPGKMGDIKRLEAFDVGAGSVLVAMRQGGLEAVNLSDALLKPADQSRTTLPHYNPGWMTINRRAPFVWKIGTPLAAQATVPSYSLTNKTHGTFGLSAGRKAAAQFSAKNASNKADSFAADFEVDPQDEVLFLGRKDNNVYFCERSVFSFRILKLSTNPEASTTDTTQ